MGTGFEMTALLDICNTMADIFIQTDAWCKNFVLKRHFLSHLDF